MLLSTVRYTRYPFENEQLACYIIENDSNHRGDYLQDIAVRMAQADSGEHYTHFKK
jgi:hypothetical protein